MIIGGYYMPSFKYVIELNDHDKAELLDIVKKDLKPQLTGRNVKRRRFQRRSPER